MRDASLRSLARALHAKAELDCCAVEALKDSGDLEVSSEMPSLALFADSLADL